MANQQEDERGPLSGYQWRAVGTRVVSSYAGERETFGENAGTTIAECMSEEHARLIVALHNLLTPAEAALQYLLDNPPKGNIRNPSHFSALNKHANGICKPLHEAIAMTKPLKPAT